MTDLLNPTWSSDQKDQMISKEKFLRYQEKINPASHHYLTENKIIFHQYCTEHNLPVPELVAVIDPAKRSYWGSGNPITTKEDFLVGLSQYPFDLICKPVHGAQGKDITNLHFNNENHIVSSNGHTSLSDFANSVFEHRDTPYILQKKLYSHKDIVDLTDNDMLQSLRMITYLDQNNQPQLIIRKIKLPRKGSIVDNFSFGISKGRQCKINEEGLVTKTLAFCEQKQRLVTHDYVKNANGEISRFKIPYWEQCVETVLNAQKIFAPLRTIGWDVGITDDGPVLIEGNIFWDPLIPQEGGMKEICQIFKSM